jgi:hypothetical protein
MMRRFKAPTGNSSENPATYQVFLIILVLAFHPDDSAGSLFFVVSGRRRIAQRKERRKDSACKHRCKALRAQDADRRER